MNIKQRLIMLVLPVAMLISGGAYAAVLLPALDIQNLSGDDGVDLKSFTFDIDATAFTIVTGGTPIDIANESFTLTSTLNSTVGFNEMGSFSGSFIVGGGLLTGIFDDLTVMSLGGADGQFGGAVTYTGGSLQGRLTGGSITGVFSESIFIPGLLNTTAKLGAVVPVPAAVWLFGSGLIGLVGLARRKA